MDQPPAVAFTVFADAWPMTRETEIGATLCAIGAGSTLTFDFFYLALQPGKSRDAQSVGNRAALNASAPETAELTREVPLSKHRKGFLRKRMSIASMLSWSKVLRYLLIAWLPCFNFFLVIW